MPSSGWGIDVNKIALFSRDRAPAAVPAADGGAYRYWAFLSYSHADTKAADRLHRWLEHFRLPDSMVGQEHPLGTIPKRLTPIFRDRHELAAASSLGREIEEALQSSRYLIVLCSPAAAKSRWVDGEIRNFKRLHGEDRVLAAIIDGEPFSESDDECFPPALRHKVGRDGKITKQKVEPIAADLRPDRDGPRLGSLKVAAGMLEVGLDDLIQREQQRRQRRMTWIVAGSVVGMAFTSGLSVVAINARDAARDERRQAEGLVSFLLGDLKDELEPIGRLDALDQVGARALAYYERQDKTDLTDDQLAQRSKALTLLGQIATSRGDTAGAEARYLEALRSTAELVDRAPDNPQRLFDHAQNVFWAGELARQRGRMDQAEASYRQYKLLADRMVAIDPKNPKWRMEELYAKENIGIVLFFQRRYSESAREIGGTVPTLEALIARDPDNEEYLREYSNVLAWLADARKNEGDLKGAIETRTKEVAFLRARIAEPRTSVQLKQRVLPAQTALGRLLADTGQLRKSVEQYRATIRDAESMLAIEPNNASWKGSAAGARIELAEILGLLNQRANAANEIRLGCEAASSLRARDRQDVNWHSFETDCLLVRSKLAMSGSSEGDPLSFARLAVRSSGAERSIDRVRDKFRLAAAYRQLGDVLRRSGDRTGAEQAWQTAYLQLPGNVVERPSEISERASLLRRLGRFEEARPLVDRLRQMGFRRMG